MMSTMDVFIVLQYIIITFCALKDTMKTVLLLFCMLCFVQLKRRLIYECILLYRNLNRIGHFQFSFY